METVSAKASIRPGVIWITGYSAAGKTTVARVVNRILRERGAQTVFLDGDDLRSIFAGRWGYSREERIELGRIYFRLCSHLSSQGLVVIIAAVSMYDEVRQWVARNISNAIEVYLNVPEAERRRRDSATKNLYNRVGDLNSIYDPPTTPDLVLDNFGVVSPEQLAIAIVDRFVSGMARKASRGRQEYWQQFYEHTKGVFEPSSFAISVEHQLVPNSEIVEVGCGNGRDAAFFAERGHNVLGLDISAQAIDLSRSKHNRPSLTFDNLTLSALRETKRNSFDAVYSRFCLHAMTLDEEIETFEAAAAVLKPRGLLFVECRSINDPLARLGEVISPTERIHGHYRRFIIKDELLSRARVSGFEVLEVIEGSGLAVFGDEDPLIIRLKAFRQP
jgi:bifunctional enzyme CysN/CysC